MISPCRQGNSGLPAPRYPKWLASCEIDKFNVSEARGHNAAWEVLRTCQPSILCKSPLVQQLLERWTLPYLVSASQKTKACWESNHLEGDTSHSNLHVPTTGEGFWVEAHKSGGALQRREEQRILGAY